MSTDLAPKRRAVGAAERDLVVVVDLLARQTLSNTQELRMIAPKLYKTALIKMTLCYYKQGEHYLKLYQTKIAKGGAEVQAAGEPFWWIFVGLLMGAMEDTKLNEEEKRIIKEVLDDLEDSNQKATKFVEICRLKKAYGEGNKKLLLGWTPLGEQVCRVILSGIIKNGGRIAQGTAPRGNNERQIQDWLESRQ